jgi:hypothetical protein
MIESAKGQSFAHRSIYSEAGVFEHTANLKLQDQWGFFSVCFSD